MIHPTAIIYDGVTIEEGVYIGPYCVIGGPPEDLKYIHEKPKFSVTIRSGARLSEFVTVHSGTVRETIIGSNTVVFQKTHIAHDCHIGNDVIIGGQVTLAGHTIVMSHANINGKAATVPRCVIGPYAFLGASALLTQHLPPGEKWVGTPARWVSNNDIGLQRANTSYDSLIKSFWMTKYNNLTQEQKV